MGTQNVAASAAEDTTIYAKLVRGRVYFLGDLEFRRDETELDAAGKVYVVVTPEQREHLETHAVDAVSLEGEADVDYRPKFEFFVGHAAVEQHKAKATRRIAQTMQRMAEEAEAVDSAQPRARRRQRG